MRNEASDIVVAGIMDQFAIRPDWSFAYASSAMLNRWRHAQHAPRAALRITRRLTRICQLIAFPRPIIILNCAPRQTRRRRFSEKDKNLATGSRLLSASFAKWRSPPEARAKIFLDNASHELGTGFMITRETGIYRMLQVISTVAFMGNAFVCDGTRISMLR